MLARILVARYWIELRAARAWGRGWRWLTSEWRSPLGLLAATFLVFSLPGFLAGTTLSPTRPARLGTWTPHWAPTLALFTLLWLLQWAWQARKRMVVEEFADCTREPTKDQPNPVARGVSTLLLVHLTRLRDLYREVDEQRATPTAVGNTKPLDAGIKVDDDSEVLKGAASPDTKFSLGPVTLPVGTLMALLNRFVQGPRIVGSLHKDGDTLILTAQKVGGGPSFSWRVDNRPPPGQWDDEKSDALEPLVQELAVRMFTDLALTGSVKWRAASLFSEALQLYRDCLRTPRDRRLKLIEAERKFAQALCEDEQFILAFYNLGVVYSELGRSEAAEAAYLKVLEKDPFRADAYYALASTYLGNGNHHNAIEACRRVIALRPRTALKAQAFYLMGYSQRLIGDLPAALRSRTLSVRYAWKALCAAERQRGDGAAVPPLRRQTGQCLRNLAVAHGYVADACLNHLAEPAPRSPWRTKLRLRRAFRQSEVWYRRASLVSGEDASLQFELGKIYDAWGRPRQAIAAFRAATQAAPTVADYWAHLAQSLAPAGLQAEAEHACRKVMRHAPDVALPAFDQVAEALGHFVPDGAQRQSALRDVLAQLRGPLQNLQQGSASAAEWEGRQDVGGRETPGWEGGMLALRLGQIYLTAGDSVKAEARFRTALEKLTDYPETVRLYGVQTLLSRSLRAQGTQEKYREALRLAEQARWREPLSAFEWEEVGEMFYALNEYEQARRAWEGALLWSPNSGDVHLKLGICHYQIAQNSRLREQGEDAMGRAQHCFETALGLADSTAPGEGDKLQSQAPIYYWRGLMLLEVEDHATAIACLKVVKALEFAPLTTALNLGICYLFKKDFNECEREAAGLISLAEGRHGAAGDVNAPADGGDGEAIPMGKLLALAHLLPANSLLERGANLEAAREHIALAKGYYEGLTDAAAKVECQAVATDLEGWALSNEGRTDEAIPLLERSIALRDHPEVYLRLALAYETVTRDSRDPARSRQARARARACCEHILEIDVKKKSTQVAADLLQRLPANPPPPPGAALASAAEGVGSAPASHVGVESATGAGRSA